MSLKSNQCSNTLSEIDHNVQKQVKTCIWNMLPWADTMETWQQTILFQPSSADLKEADVRITRLQSSDAWWRWKRE